MKDADVILKALQIAGENGFRFRNFLDEEVRFEVANFHAESGRLVIMARNREQHKLIYDRIYLIFFNVDFAKALFGKDWATHLEELASSGDKISYLREFITEKIK